MGDYSECQLPQDSTENISFLIRSYVLKYHVNNLTLPVIKDELVETKIASKILMFSHLCILSWFHLSGYFEHSLLSHATQ